MYATYARTREFGSSTVVTQRVMPGIAVMLRDARTGMRSSSTLRAQTQDGFERLQRALLNTCENRTAIVGLTRQLMVALEEERVAEIPAAISGGLRLERWMCAWGTPHYSSVRFMMN